MSDPVGLMAAIFSAIATGFAAYATWQAPRAAAKLAESLRQDSERAQERQKKKVDIFTILMQERGEVYSEGAVKAFNLIDVIFYDCREVREAWAELFQIFGTNPSYSLARSGRCPVSVEHGSPLRLFHRGLKHI
jgi:hypothetical protein